MSDAATKGHEGLEIVYGWEEIARVHGRSVRTAQQRAARGFDPLPVLWEDDRPMAYVRAILDWRARQRSSFKLHSELMALRAEVGRLRAAASSCATHTKAPLKRGKSAREAA